jgi:hypothetical protein
MASATPIITWQGANKIPRQIETQFRRENQEWVTTYNWIGLEADLYALADTKSGYSVVEIGEYRFPFFKLSVTYRTSSTLFGGNPPTPDQGVLTLYTLQSGFEQRDAWLHPTLAAEMRKISDVQVAAKIRSLVDQLVNGVQLWQPGPTSANGAVPAPVALTWQGVILPLIKAAPLVPGVLPINATIIQNFAFAFSRGATQYRVDTVILQKKQVVPNGASITANYDIINVPLTLATLLSYCPGLPHLMANNLQLKFANGYWFAGGPVASQIDANRTQLDQEFVYADTYEPIFYGLPR